MTQRADPEFPIPVSGGDYFAFAIDHMMRRRGMPGNLCRMMLEMSGRVDRNRMLNALESLPIARRLARLRMRRPIIGFAHRWVTDPNAGPLDVQVRTEQNALPALIRPDRAPVFKLTIMRTRINDSLVLDWHHCLMDVDGALAFLNMLRNAYNGAPAQNGICLAHPDQRLEPMAKRLKEFPKRIQYCRPSLAFITQTSRAPIAAFAPRRARSWSPQINFHVVRFSENESERITQNLADNNATLFASAYFLACSIRGLAPTLRERNLRDDPVLVPTPHSMRSRDEQTALLSNLLSFMFYRIEPDRLGDVRLIYESLLAQMRNQIAGKFPQKFHRAMDLFRPVPMPIYSFQLRRSTTGKMATFYYSYIGEERDRGGDAAWGDARVSDITHLPAVGSPPGLALVHYRSRGLPRMVIAWTDDVLGEIEIETIAVRIKGVLLGEAR